MKIKKTTQMIILVVALVAVLGVGAVSFAAWQGGTMNFTATADVGTVTLLGFDSTDMTFGKKLVPYNQTAGKFADDSARVTSAAIPAHTVTGDYQIKVSLNTDGTTIDQNTKVYAKFSTSAITEAPTALDGWTVLGALTSETQTVTAGEETTVNEGVLYLNLVLDSQAKSDMNAHISLTVELIAA